LYFGKLWSWHYDGAADNFNGMNSKHIFVGETRIATKAVYADGSFIQTAEEESQYYYHSDHLGSAQLITDWQGKEYERFEYTPYGEVWIEKASAVSALDVPYRFTGKERDKETGLYYFGARYLDPRESRWLSVDPAMGEYVPGPGQDAGELPGMGGVFNTVNLHVYHYAGNNPVKYVDPDGRESGYVREKDAVGGMGHAGVFTRTSNGKYIFTEIIRIVVRKDDVNHVLTKKGNINTGGGYIGAINKQEIAALEFNTRELMIEFLGKKGFADYIEFETTPQQEVAIREATLLLGREYTDYMIPGNHCGIFAERALDAGGKGIKTNANTRGFSTAVAIGSMLFGDLATKAFGLYQGINLQSPNSIGDQLMVLNKGKIVKINEPNE
jgi:RHS repeat-associated protein